MNYKSTTEIREIWNDFWKEKNHFLIESKSLIPYNDDSLLFINSGVATIKNYLSGIEIPPSKRLVSSQKSLRTNDIENVGITSRHHTMFEMLGNFSIGDYFKKEAIKWGYELLTGSDYYDLDVDKLYVTVYPTDEESVKYWIEAGIDPEHIVKLEENFWEIGKGPGGPNTEIFFDRGEKYDNRDVLRLLQEDLENDRIIEIWNIVFSQYNCDPVVPREKYVELPQKNIDTGMGLERMASVLQEVDTNYETDNFQMIIQAIEKITDKKYEDNIKEFRIITDHIRALVFAISDGVTPSSDGRGYVIRRVLRRALKNAYQKLDIKEEPFLYKLVDSVIGQMKDYYPELVENKKIVEDIIRKEEESFLQTLKTGIKYFNEMIESVQENTISGDIAFKLYDTYGFPYELTEELARELDYTVDERKFKENLQEQRERARNSRKDITSITKQNEFLTTINLKSKFIGYDTFQSKSKIILITDLNKEINVLEQGTIGYMVFDQTPFYATSGGQKSDIGLNEKLEIIEVTKLLNGSNLHKVYALEDLKKNDIVDLKIDMNYRKAISKNHSATHLLHLALQKVIGDVAHQAGSDQNNLRTRFDYTTHQAPTQEQIREIQIMVNNLIKKKDKVNITEMSLDAAKKLGAQALFGEKYGQIVRVVQMGESLELCGGTHVANTGEIEKFYIVHEESVGSGVRRIEAITSEEVDTYIETKKAEFIREHERLRKVLTEKKILKLNDLHMIFQELENLEDILGIDIREYSDQFSKLAQENNKLTLELDRSSQNFIDKKAEEIIKKYSSEELIIEEFVQGINTKELKELADKILNKHKSGVVIVKLIDHNKITIVVKVSQDKTSKYNAGEIVKEKLMPYNGKGGGKLTFGQGGGEYNE